MTILDEHYRLPIDKLLKIQLKEDSKPIYGRFVSWDYFVSKDGAKLPPFLGLYFRYSSDSDLYYKNLWECKYEILNSSDIYSIETIPVKPPPPTTALDYISSNCRAYNCRFYFFDCEEIGVINDFFPTEHEVFYLVRKKHLQKFKECSEGDNRNEDQMKLLCEKIDFAELIVWGKIP